jgi:hypothetical protein
LLIMRLSLVRCRPRSPGLCQDGPASRRFVPGFLQFIASRCASEMTAFRVHPSHNESSQEIIMTSRLTLSALAFSLLSTVALVGVAETGNAQTNMTATRVVQLERVLITVPRLTAKA